VNSVKVLERRYLLKDEHGRVVETPKEMFRRVARTVARVEKKHHESAEEEKFYQLMSGFLFLPNSPTLMNAGTSIGQLSACFVIPVKDSMEGIFEAVKDMALIHQSGGGTGFSFSRLRPRGDVVQSTKGIASGPVGSIHKGRCIRSGLVYEGI
jgi:ribonucleoside-diphosphate reductase alpha chain